MTLKHGLKVKIAQGYRNQHASIRTHDFLLKLHSNHGTVSYRFRDKRWFQSEIAKFSHPRIFGAPADGVRLGIGYRRTESKKTRMMWPGAPAGFQSRVGKIRREAPKKNFLLPTLVFSLPTLPYVTVAHPAHRTEAGLREKASLPINQEGPSPPPSVWPSLTVRPSYTHAWSMTTGKR